MFAILRALGIFVADMFKSRYRLQAENLFLRYQLNIALRRASLKVCVPKTLSALMGWQNRLSRRNDRVVQFIPCSCGLAIQVKEPT
jgi:hypothetical protein